MSSAPPARPFSDAYLLAYSAEHVAYEFDMFLWLAKVMAAGASLAAPTPAETTRLNNVLIEGFVVHLRNVIDFLYLDNPKPTDVVAADFFAPSAWQSMRPAMSATLQAARVRANKEIAHLTTDRIEGTPPNKGWDFGGLATEIRPILTLMATHALAARLSPNVSAVVA